VYATGSKREAPFNSRWLQGVPARQGENHPPSLILNHDVAAEARLAPFQRGVHQFARRQQSLRANALVQLLYTFFVEKNGSTFVKVEVENCYRSVLRFCEK
jgi:hypothetical protein